MFEEILLIGCFALGGAIFALFVLGRFTRRQSMTVHEQPPSVTPEKLEATKSEIETLEFERTILSHSITSSYEFAQGNGMSQERDRLVTKYKSQLDNINKRIGELQLSLEFTELSEARNKLVSLLQAKITSLDGRLSEMSHKYGLPMDHLAENRLSKQYEETKTYSKSIKTEDPMAELPNNESDEMAVKEVQHEILQALNRLENAGTNELLTSSSHLEPNTSTEGDNAMSFPQNNQSNKKSDIVSTGLSVSRDALSYIVRSNPT